MELNRDKRFEITDIDIDEPNPLEKITDKMAEKLEEQNHCNHLVGILTAGEIDLLHYHDLINQFGIYDIESALTDKVWGLHLLNYCPYCGKEFDGDKLKELYLHRVRVNAKIDKDCFSYNISEKEFEKYYKEVR